MSSGVSDFYDLNSWKESHGVVILVYKLIKNFPKEEKYGICDQFSDKIRFYYQARGSAKEVQNFLILARDLGYIDKELIKTVWGQTKVSEKLINGLISSAEKQKI